MAGPRSDAADGNAERMICDRGERRSADRASSEPHRQQTRDAGVGSGRVDLVGSGASLGPKCRNLGLNMRSHSGRPPVQRGASKWWAAGHWQGGIAPDCTTCTGWHLKAHWHWQDETGKLQPPAETHAGRPRPGVGWSESCPGQRGARGPPAQGPGVDEHQWPSAGGLPGRR